MKRRIVLIGITLLLLAYVASYFVCRKVYETREDEFITLYDEDSLVALVAHLVHSPLIVADSAITGRRIDVGNWRDPLPPDMLERLRTNEVEHAELEKGK